MDRRRDDQTTTTDLAEDHRASEPPSSWVRPGERQAATPTVEEAAGPPAPVPHVGVPTDAPPSPPQAPGNGQTDGIAVADAQSPVEPRDHESTEPDRPQPEAAVEGQVELMAVDSRKQYRARWAAIQTGFVDDPAEAVREADHLVADVMKHLATTVAEERGRLEERWSQGNEDTEHLRMALQRYRQFFGLLLKE